MSVRYRDAMAGRPAVKQIGLAVSSAGLPLSTCRWAWKEARLSSEAVVWLAVTGVPARTCSSASAAGVVMGVDILK